MRLIQATDIVVRKQVASTSMLQHELGVEPGTAGLLMDPLEAHGVVGPSRGAAAREVLIGRNDITYALGRIASGHNPS